MTGFTSEIRAAAQAGTEKAMLARAFDNQQRLRRPRTVPVTMPESVWGRLASIADNNDSTVAEVIADALQQVVDEGPNHRMVLSWELNAARAEGFRVPRRGVK